MLEIIAYCNDDSGRPWLTAPFASTDIWFSTPCHSTASATSSVVDPETPTASATKETPSIAAVNEEAFVTSAT